MSVRVQVVAVWVTTGWTDVARLRLWAKQVPTSFCILLTDDVTEANTVLARQLKCSDVTVGLIRLPGALRSADALWKARVRRDEVMVSLADEVVVFGSDPRDVETWRRVEATASKTVTIFHAVEGV